WLYRFLREPERAEAVNRQAIAISAKHDFPLIRDMAMAMMGGIVVAGPSGASDRLALVEEGLNCLSQAGARTGSTEFLYCLAVAYEQSGEGDNAMEKVNNALVANTEERVFLPNLLRYRGELRHREGARDMAETDIRESMVRARSMNAKSWE